MAQNLQQFNFNSDLVRSDLIRLGIAYVLSLPIAWNRERDERSAGLRTFPLVAVGSCGLMLIVLDLGGTTPDSLSRILQGLVTGIGFIGGGAILRDKEGYGVRGTATAASVWNVGIIGAAAGLGLYDIAIVLSVVSFFTLQYLSSFKREVRKGEQAGIRRSEDGP